MWDLIDCYSNKILLSFDCLNAANKAADIIFERFNIFKFSPEQMNSFNLSGKLKIYKQYTKEGGRDLSAYLTSGKSWDLIVKRSSNKFTLSSFTIHQYLKKYEEVTESSENFCMEFTDALIKAENIFWNNSPWGEKNKMKNLSNQMEESDIFEKRVVYRAVSVDFEWKVILEKVVDVDEFKEQANQNKPVKRPLSDEDLVPVKRLKEITANVTKITE